MILEDDGGPPLNLKQLGTDQRLLVKYIQAVTKKLKKYTDQLRRDQENKAYMELI